MVKKKVGTGGNNKRRLAGKGPTPKAEDRTYHPAAKRKKAAAKKGKPAKAGAKDQELEIQDDPPSRAVLVMVQDLNL